MKTYDFKFVMLADDNTNMGSRFHSFEAESSDDAITMAVEYSKTLFAVEGPKRIQFGYLVVESVQTVENNN